MMVVENHSGCDSPSYTLRLQEEYSRVVPDECNQLALVRVGEEMVNSF